MHSLSAMGDLAPAVMWRLRRMIDRGGRLPEIWRLPETVTEIGLSFDDGPTAETTPALIELLRAHQATATFFLTGDRATATPELVKALVDAGHDVFPHGWDHIRYGRLRPDIAVRDLDRAEAMLSRIRPTPSPYLVRLPYGSGHGDPRLHRAIRQWNPASQIVNWDYDTRDWAMADGCGDEAQLKIIRQRGGSNPRPPWDCWFDRVAARKPVRLFGALERTRRTAADVRVTVTNERARIAREPGRYDGLDMTALNCGKRPGELTGLAPPPVTIQLIFRGDPVNRECLRAWRKPWRSLNMIRSRSCCAEFSLE